MIRSSRKVENEFRDRFGKNFTLVHSPGRVNLIGEHTDYNEGFVLPAAIDKVIVLAIAPNQTNRMRFYASDMEESFEADLTEDLSGSGLGWPDYLLGVVDQLQKRGYEPEGFDCVFGGNIPIGAGLSSSAALEGGVIFGLNHLFGLNISRVEMAKIAQKAENEFVGVQCGIMDQFVSLNGKADHALRLDCRSLEYDHYPLKQDDVNIVLCDTQVRRELAGSEYNVRRQQCEQGVGFLRQFDSGLNSLRDVSLDLLEEHKEKMDSVVYRRCKYVIQENERVLAACRDLQTGDLEAFGQKMFASHTGLRDEYEVSCKELDVLVDAARNIDGVLGARMMGGGFGGCTINLVPKEHVPAFTDAITQAYKEQTGSDVEIYLTTVSGGTRIVGQEQEEVKAYKD